MVGGGSGGVVCVNGTGGLGGQISSCFNSRSGRSLGMVEVIRGISSFSCVLIGARFRTLILRYSLVGRRVPGCGVLLGSSGNCGCVGVAGNSFPVVSRYGHVSSSNTACVNPCVSGFSIGRTIRRALGVFGLPHYDGQFPRSCNGSHPYLGNFVKLYSTPYTNGVARTRCLGGMGSTITFLGNNDRTTIERVATRVGRLSRGLRFRRTTGLHSEVHTVGGLSRQRGIISVGIPRRSIFTLMGNGGGTYFRIVHFRGNGLASARF